ncbi:MAG: outer membrane beta-barrel protein [Kiritimatiellae bacterium]|nr:outer membrane beta-barrel protein [Kiritimatiellia bacterium]
MNSKMMMSASSALMCALVCGVAVDVYGQTKMFNYSLPNNPNTRAEFMRQGVGDRGFHFGNLELSPYVNAEYKYNNNVDTDRHKYHDSSLYIRPGIDLKYTGSNWGLTGNGWYSRTWHKNYDELDSRRYSERLGYWYQTEGGLRIVLSEQYSHSEDHDSIIDGGRGIWREREELRLSGVVSYQLGERTGVALGMQYHDMDYKRNSKYANLYGYDEFAMELELSRKLSERTNFLLAGGYQTYRSDGTSRGYNHRSNGYSVMAGLGSRATERITYRALTGVGFWDYSGDVNAAWKYSLNANWMISHKWALSLAGSSYFQPSERDRNQSVQTYTLSSGLSYRPIKRLSTHLDAAVRYEQNEYASNGRDDSWEEMVSVRLRGDYHLIRCQDFSANLYSSLEFNKEFSDRDDYEYDQFILRVGLRLFY